ncbi:hypothetical protein P152DRAFT_301661 [Eremomyces bilateralis CBS 781.70]|uniref:Uncharacterized protein n=1 Tax=Eremomyces bilateralis CBS 781.70 TaxID=1392243 RepID=A0A6G1G7M6_9PEZI|nr:uncharacterized protein P152DRAFT_301661 [Eremomyces bilateralis CBS 781.70]KAF1814012.1 hypothetical protein P152DRAFT_301661 [Eremomyces bilateralis CBS 781.70]
MASTAPPRRFKVEPIETTRSTRKGERENETGETQEGKQDSAEPAVVKIPRRYAPVPIETTVVHRRAAKDRDTDVETKTDLKEGSESSTTTNQQTEAGSIANPRPRRNFAPQLLETAVRSRRVGKTSPSRHVSGDIDDTDRDCFSHLVLRRSELASRTPSPLGISQAELQEARRIGSPLLSRSRQSSVGSARSHSYQVPHLDTIESSESEESISRRGSLSNTPPTPASSRNSYKHATRIRESADETTSAYFLRVAAKTAERQLREQAMAAFPNDDRHEPVAHFINRDLDTAYPSRHPTHDSTKRYKYRRESSEANWQIRGFRKRSSWRDRKRHAERRQKASGDSSNNDSWRHPMSGLSDGGMQRDTDLEQMRNKARPPMLGGDIVFPRCPSPNQARFDVTQSSYVIRQSMCYLSEQAKEPDREGLWRNKSEANLISSSRESSSIWTGRKSPSNNPKSPSTSGLWGGSCTSKDALTVPRGPTGMITPKVIDEDELIHADHPLSNHHQLPPSPPSSYPGPTSLDEKLSRAALIDAEFHPEFVTQVYNYLSLGYPAVARAFDPELSKITHIPIAELRQDDHLASSKGYFRLGEDFCADGVPITREACIRWRALRLYAGELGVVNSRRRISLS